MISPGLSVGVARTPRAPLTIAYWQRKERIPHLIACIDMMTALGAGMTVKYFPIFFKEVLLLTPLQVFAHAVLTHFGSYSSERAGTEI